MLRAFADNIPKGHTIEEKYVAYYHQLLTDVARETGQDLDYFRVPDGELSKRSAGGHGDEYGNWEEWYTDHRQCDTPVFMIKFNGALNFVASLLEQPGKRIIGF
jgi:hypothetical protein